MESFRDAVGLGGNKDSDPRQEGEGGQPAEGQKEGGFLSGIGNKLNAAAGGGPESEKNEDLLDKGMLLSANSLLAVDVHFQRSGGLCPRSDGRW